MQSLRIVDIVPSREQMYSQIDFSRFLDGLFQHVLRAPLNIFQKRPMKFLEANQVISSVLGWPEHHLVLPLRENLRGLRKDLLRQGRAVGPDQAN